MNRYYKWAVVLGVFIAIALGGIAFSRSVPYVKSDDEVVYLIGALQAKEHNLPDAYMLQGDDYGPYLYPKVMSFLYEPLGYDTFKSLYLEFLVIATGIAAYVMFRRLWLPFLPALLMAIVALMPRFSSGQEIFGVFTFRDAIGRASAYPLFFLGTGFLIQRLIEKKSMWPVFLILGLCLFLHPVTVMLFAFVSLFAMAIVLLVQREPILHVIRDVFVSGCVFVAAGAYFFVSVFERLSNGVSDAGATPAMYVQAIMARNAWEFPDQSLLWFRHMAVVTAFFIVALVIFYTLPKLRALRARYPFPQGRTITVWGIAVAAGALIFTIALPGINLYLMQHADAPYVFQQWSRISKFCYLGIFITLVPMVYILWKWYQESTWRLKSIVVAILFVMGVASSTIGFEFGQFVIGYKNFEKSYVPQALSGLPNDTTPAEYREACKALTDLGAKPEDEIISGDFSFRYYCRANLYVTFEEGGAYQQLTRADVVDWYTRYLAQQAGFKGTDPQTMIVFAKSISAHFLIVSNSARYDAFRAFRGWQVLPTSKYLVIKVTP